MIVIFIIILWECDAYNSDILIKKKKKLYHSSFLDTKSILFILMKHKNKPHSITQYDVVIKNIDYFWNFIIKIIRSKDSELLMKILLCYHKYTFLKISKKYYLFLAI